MIAHRDFPFKLTGFIPNEARNREHFDQVVAGMNQWIAGESVDVISVETIGIHAQYEHPMIRVWYRATPVKPDSIDEV